MPRRNVREIYRRGEQQASRADRRSVLAGVAGLGLVAPFAVRGSLAATDPRQERPQPGDVFVREGDDKMAPIAAQDLPLGGPQVLAWPMELKSRTVRDGSGLNQVALVRLDPGTLSEQTSKAAAEGVVAYSAFCTHEGCPVSMWEGDKGALFCSCHGSQFDPRDAAKIVNGPAKRRLAMLPLKIQDGLVVTAGEFIGKLGIKR